MSDRTQLILPIPPPPADSMTPLVPARMVNEWVYCPRLAYLEWVEGEWADSADTVQGKRAHTRVDKGGGRLPSPDELDEEMSQARSITMSSERLGVIAKMDVLSIRDGVVMPVDFKKGKRPHVAAGAYEPERVQVCVQAMILEDNGYQVEQGAIWYVGSRERVQVNLDEDLRTRTLEAVRELRAAARRALGRLRWRTVRSVPDVRWRASASRTRRTCSTAAIRPGPSTHRTIPPFRSTSKPRARGCARRASV